MFPNDPIFLDIGPKSDLFGQKCPKMVWFYTQKPDFDKNEEKKRQITYFDMILTMHWLFWEAIRSESSYKNG